jgi:hypothetical protein
MTIKKPTWRRIELWKLRKRKAGAHKSKKDKLEELDRKEFNKQKDLLR